MNKQVWKETKPGKLWTLFRALFVLSDSSDSESERISSFISAIPGKIWTAEAGKWIYSGK